jgi:hypothetical protein
MSSAIPPAQPHGKPDHDDIVYPQVIPFLLVHAPYSAALWTGVTALDETHGETVAAVYVPAKQEILLANDLDLGTPLARSYLVHELVHAQQFTSRAHEQVQCPGALEANAYGAQAHHLSTSGLREEAFLLQISGMFQSACGYSY